jgi:MFS family permease
MPAETFRVYPFLWLWAFALVYGLSLGMHLSNLGFAPAFVLFILLVDWRILLRPWVWLVGAGFFFLGALQFLWLPYKASTLNDVNMLRNAPSTLEGIYRYTLGAFPEFKFAFPLQAIPERIVLYLYLLVQNFRLPGVLLGLVGMAALLWRAPRRFFLFIGLYLVQVFFFVQYRAFDIDVFFIPAHFCYAVFIGFGLYAGLLGLSALFQTDRRWKRAAWAVLSGLVALALVLGLTRQVRANWEHNDYSTDTAINDFYENVFDLLPPDSALLGRGGVFGYDMFYFRLVYNYRPDVAMPMIDGPRPSARELAGRSIYTTQPLQAGRGGGGPWSPPPGLVSRDAWYVPILLGQSGVGTGMREQGQPLTLYAAQDTPPELIVGAAQPQHVVGQSLEGLELVGYDLDDSRATPGGRLRLTLYWRGQPPRALIATSLGDATLETHPLGLGNLARYIQEVRPLRNGIVVEDYWVVVPSTLEPGDYPLQVRIESPLPAWAEESPPTARPITLESVTIAEETNP